MPLLLALLAITSILALLGAAAQAWGVDTRESVAGPHGEPARQA